MRNKLFLSILIAIFPLTIFCQENITISGKIIDATTKKPIPFATIFYKYGGTIGGEFGFFRITDAQITDTLKISCIGYKNKFIPVSELKTSDPNIIFIDKHIYKLSEVKVKAKKKRLGSIQIIRNALSRIEHNYPVDPVLYNGYYREYLLQNSEYFNLLEAIIDIEDLGFGTADKFNARILYKKQNQNFEIVEDALVPYDNTSLKTVPDATMPKICNELLLLRIHDPIRRSDHFALSYIDTLQKNFIRNHHFKKPQLVHFNNKALYFIEFKNANLINNKAPMASTIGEIYIDPDDWGIHKLVYQAYTNVGKLNEKLYELNLSYQQNKDGYSLKYLSFNNFFELEDLDKLFQIDHVIFMKETQKVKIMMNKYIDLSKNNPLKNSRYHIKFNDRLFNVDEVNIYGKDIILDSESFSKIVRTRDSSDVDKVWVEIKDIYDMFGSKIDERHFETFYQYREFFVKNSSEKYEVLDKTEFYDPNLPMLKNPVYIKQYNDTTWINTPLIKQNKNTK